MGTFDPELALALSREAYRAARAELAEKNAQIERLRAAIRDAISNLGVPQPGYPAPVVEAHRILNDAISGTMTTKPQEKPDLSKEIAAYYYWSGTEDAAQACENIGKEIVCPEECAAVIRALADKPTAAKLVPVERLLLAFVDGAKWWEFETSGGTMWQADQHRAFSEAELRSGAGTIGITVDERVKRAAALREEEI